MLQQMLWDIEQIKQDNKDLNEEENNNRDIVREFRYKKKFCTSDKPLMFVKAKCYKKYEETYEFLKITADRLLRGKNYGDTTKRMILGRLGLEKGYVEPFEDLEGELGVTQQYLRDIWVIHGKDILDKLQQEYKKVEEKC